MQPLLVFAILNALLAIGGLMLDLSSEGRVVKTIVYTGSAVTGSLGLYFSMLFVGYSL